MVNAVMWQELASLWVFENHVELLSELDLFG